ncbi:peptidoglycan-binding protein [Streptomyces jietaisiensis]|uniref:peptidoglycan-binding domain-containing protein n=1 Tax=Streptomyces griseoaurantiacus TaxID=68213 RepID=UPI002E2B9768|nr:peptidoglycan-binding protein [Streptomyces jietaisiensis]
MSGTNQQACPECAAPRDPEGSPTCACTQRTAEALRDTRTAEAAAAEDFDPLRIRPYVGLTPKSGTTPGAEGGTTPGAEGGTAAGPEGGTPAGTPEQAPGSPGNGVREPHAAQEVPEGPRDPQRPPRTPEDPQAPETPESPEDAVFAETRPLDLGTTVGGGGRGEAPRARAPRRTVVLAAGGAVVAVLTATALATGLFSYGKPERNDALPDEVRPSVPAGSATPTATGPADTSSASTTGTGSASPSDTASATATASGGRTASSSATPSATRTARDAQATSEATRSKKPATGEDQHQDPPVLRRGDDGPEVEELQRRLRQRLFYLGTVDGTYDGDVETAVAAYQSARGITDDPRGVYGETTRARLESETDEP